MGAIFYFKPWRCSQQHRVSTHGYTGRTTATSRWVSKIHDVGKETQAYSMTSLQQFIVNTLDFNVNRDPKSSQAFRVTQRHTGVNDGFLSHFALSQATCYELDGAEEAP
jgi:hypothetical protein